MNLYLVRHGATEWSEAGRHTSVTDLPLLPAGEEAAKRLAPRLAGIEFGQVLVSPRVRARRTAELAGFPDAVVDEDLVEWDYGEYEGITSAQIRERDPDWTIWDGVTPGGESAAQVAARLDRVVARVRDTPVDTLVFAHGHCLRALAARWLGEPVRLGRFLILGTATLSVLGDDRGQPAIETWNAASLDS
jgi:probable phosphoglycerate mutase